MKTATAAGHVPPVPLALASDASGSAGEEKPPASDVAATSFETSCLCRPRLQDVVFYETQAFLRVIDFIVW